MAPSMTTMATDHSTKDWNEDSSKAAKHSITDTNFAGPLWLRSGVAELYAMGEVHTGPFSMPLLRQQKLDKLAVTPGSTTAILDVCCGSGVTTHHLQSLLKEQGLEGQIDLTCGDLSEGQLAYLDERIKAMGWQKTKTKKMNLSVRTSHPRGVDTARQCGANSTLKHRQLDSQTRRSTTSSALRASSSSQMPSPRFLVSHPLITRSCQHD